MCPVIYWNCFIPHDIINYIMNIINIYIWLFANYLISDITKVTSEKGKVTFSSWLCSFNNIKII